MRFCNLKGWLFLSWIKETFLLDFLSKSLFKIRNGWFLSLALWWVRAKNIWTRSGNILAARDFPQKANYILLGQKNFIRSGQKYPGQSWIGPLFTSSQKYAQVRSLSTSCAASNNTRQRKLQEVGWMLTVILEFASRSHTFMCFQCGAIQ